MDRVAGSARLKMHLDGRQTEQRKALTPGYDSVSFSVRLSNQIRNNFSSS
jgi:hypothetical protein